MRYGGVISWKSHTIHKFILGNLEDDIHMEFQLQSQIDVSFEKPYLTLSILSKYGLKNLTKTWWQISCKHNNMYHNLILKTKFT